MPNCNVLLVLLLGGPGPDPLEVAPSVTPLKMVQAGVEELGFDGNDWHGKPT